MCTVVNKNKEEFDIYIGRGSIWGNPYVIGKHGDRKKVIERYRKWLTDQIFLGNISIDQLQSLKGKRLGCFCKPLDCHGDVIKEFVERYGD